MQADPHRTGPSIAELKITERIMELNYREELMWRQRSRTEWLTTGDRNTRFFHLRTSRRRRRNKITKLRKPDGQFTENIAELGVMTNDLYKALYQSEGVQDMEAVLETFWSKSQH